MFSAIMRSIVSGLIFIFLSIQSFAQPSNNLCANAILINSSLTCAGANNNISGNLVGATYTTVTGACQTSTNDVWYRFTAQSTNPTITITTSVTNIRFQLYKQSCSGTSVYCSTGASATMSGLITGTIYYVRVYSTTNATGTFTICITDPSPVNDNCSGAITLTSSTTTCSSPPQYSLSSATNSNLVVNGCGGTADDDEWFNFAALGSQTTINLTNIATGTNSLANAGIVVEVFYSATSSCGALSYVTCASFSSSTIATRNVSVFTPYTTGLYYVRVFSIAAGAPTGGATFSICITHIAPPANDNCSGAIGLTSSTTTCTSPPTRTLASATNSGVAVNNCGNTANDDVWFNFTAVGSRTTINLTNIATGANSLASVGFVVEVFYSATNNCSALTYVSCTSFPSSSTASQNFTVFTPYTTGKYYVRVFSNSGVLLTGAATFSICITHIAPPANDNCANATPLTIATTNTSGTVWSATASGVATTCAGTADDDVWYSFTPTASTATITLSSVGSNLNISGTMIQLFSGTCGGTLTSLGCDNSSLYVTGLTTSPATTYYIRVYSLGAGSISGVAAGSAFSITVSGPATSTNVSLTGSRMSEVFQQTTLSGPNLLYNPWEVTYGPDGYLWITESRGYKVYRMDPNTGARTTILDISQGSQFLPATDQSFNLQFDFAGQGNPQGGLAGMALHPKFLDPVAPKNYVYLSYIHAYNSTAANNAGVFFTNSLVQFTYNTTTNRLENPVTICDTLPGSSDHNSQRMIIAPVGGTYYLFYAAGDMGAGQFGNANRMEKAQIIASYEGKILRFNLEPDGDATPAAPTPDFDKWIPNDNPFNITTPAKQSAVWSTGIRNNQGFASININGTDYLYGSSHGPFSDDEINIIQRAKNYGHPIVIGKNDGNYDNASAGANPGSLPIITSEATNVTTINNNAATLGNGNTYQDPIFSFYPVPKGTPTTTGTIQYIWTQFNPPNNNGANGGWPSEAPSGMDIYKNTLIPGWKNSLVLACLKWGRVMRLKLSSDGLSTLPTNTASDTLSYFNSTNRFRDLAFSPNGKDIFLVMDGNGATSGPSTLNPSIQACPGCVLKYTFLGYANNTGNGNRSTIPTSITVTTGTNNTCNTATTVTIDATNTNLWVPITGPDGNIMAEIKANGNILGAVTASFYTNSGTIRKDNAGKPYLDRNMTITPQTQPNNGQQVDIRLYFTASELNALISAAGSGISSISPTNLHMFKNSNSCGPAIRGTTQEFIPTYAEAFGSGYVVQAKISSFSSFYFASPGITPLPLQLITFKGTLQSNDALLQWKTANERNTGYFDIERSLDGVSFIKVGSVNAAGNINTATYAYTDKGAALLPTDVLHYRLKSVDNDGAFSYSNVITLHVPHNFDVMIFPNPVKEKLTVRINNRDAKEVTVQVSDMQGRVIYTSHQSLRSGTSNITIDVRRWVPQLYVVKVISSTAEVLATQKVEKQ